MYIPTTDEIGEYTDGMESEFSNAFSAAGYDLDDENERLARERTLVLPDPLEAVPTVNLLDVLIDPASDPDFDPAVAPVDEMEIDVDHEQDEVSTLVEEDVVESSSHSWTSGTHEGSLADGVNPSGQDQPANHLNDVDPPGSPVVSDTGDATPQPDDDRRLQQHVQEHVQERVQEHVDDPAGPLAIAVERQDQWACRHLDCSQVFLSEASARNHAKRCDFGKERPHCCDECGKRYWYPKDVRRCKEKHAKSKVDCAVITCLRKFSRRDNMIRHMNKVHPEAPIPSPQSPQGRSSPVSTRSSPRVNRNRRSSAMAGPNRPVVYRGPNIDDSETISPSAAATPVSDFGFTDLPPRTDSVAHWLDPLLREGYERPSDQQDESSTENRAKGKRRAP